MCELYLLWTVDSGNQWDDGEWGGIVGRTNYTSCGFRPVHAQELARGGSGGGGLLWSPSQPPMPQGHVCSLYTDTVLERARQGEKTRKAESVKMRLS